MMATTTTNRAQRRSAFTLIELIAVLVVLAILSAVALPKYLDHSAQARAAADDGSLAGIRTAFQMAFINHRADNVPAAQWIDAVTDIAGAMETGELPSGIFITGAKLQDQRGNTYTFTPETLSAPAKLTLDVGGGGGGGGGGS